MEQRSAVEIRRDFFFVRFHLLAFHFNEFRTCRTQPNSISRQTVEGSLGFAQTIKTSKVDRWFGLIGNQDCNQTKGMSFIAMKPHFGCDPDCFDYEKNAMNYFETSSRDLKQEEAVKKMRRPMVKFLFKWIEVG